jgi:hypothetical protein
MPYVRSSTTFSAVLSLNVTHGLINYKNTEAKFRHVKNIDLKRDFAAGVYLLEFIDWRYGQSFWFFRPRCWHLFPPNPQIFLNPPTPPPPPPPFPVWISILYTRIHIVWGGGVMGSAGSATDKHLLQSPFTGQFFLDDKILHCLISVLSFYEVTQRWGRAIGWVRE